MGLLGIGTIALVVYIASIMIINVVFKRKMAEAMMISFILLLVLGGVNGNNPAELFAEGIGFAAKQQVCMLPWLLFIWRMS